MKISLNWLQDYIDVSDFREKPQELAQVLTSAGLEVESVEDLGRRFEHVVVGQIEKLETHPNADRLTYCQVNIGSDKTQPIVCGAKNHKQGDKVVVATPGAVLPGDFHIKVSKIRDVESRGMLCSEKELGLSEEADGILILPSEAKVGQSFSEHRGLNDILFDVNVTPNRADCLSHVGLARELSCLLGRKIKLPKAKVQKTKWSTLKTVSLQVKDLESCPRYAGRLVKAIKVGPSPEWLRVRLEAVGLNSINNIVDITNFVMMEYGQPLHAFDLAELEGATIEVSPSKGEVFTSLDGTEHNLDSRDLTIRDGGRVVALAGVVGGLNSGITESTKDVFLESAHFNPANVRRTARRLGIETDSAYRFSRGTDPEGVVEAMNRAAALMEELAGGEVAADFHDVLAKRARKKAIKVRRHILEERLGYAVKLDHFAKWMKRLHCQVRMSTNYCSVDVPSFRWDLDIEMDLVEEYARLNGYDKIPESFPVLRARPEDSSKDYAAGRQLSAALNGLGFLQAINYNFVSPKWQGQCVNSQAWKASGVELPGEEIPLKNPLSEETSVMRQSLLPGLINNLIHNFHYGNSEGALFEQGVVFGKNASGFGEASRLGFVLWGESVSLWSQGREPAVIRLKSRVEGLLAKLLASSFQWKSLEVVPDILHPGQSACLFYQGKNIGFVGTLHPGLCDEHKVRTDVAVAELDVSQLMVGQPRAPKSTAISKYPAVERDLALVVPKSVSAGDLLRHIQKLGGLSLERASVFDRFEGGNIEPGFHSLGFRMRFQKLDGTLSEDEISASMEKVVQGLTAKYPVTQR